MTIDVKDSYGQSSTSIQQISQGISDPAVNDFDPRDERTSLFDSTLSMKTTDTADRRGPVIIVTEIDDVDCNDDKGDSVDDEEDENHDEVDPDHPVDTGWAWCIMLSCFLMHVLVVGGAKSFGVFVQEFQDRFGVGARELGLINGMALMLMLSQGLFVNMLAARFSGRRVVMTGSIIIVAGFVMSAFIPSFGWLYVTYGLVAGIGFALSFSPSIVMVGQHFKKYRSFAFGIALSGSGFGSFAIPNLVRVLLKEYSLQGCLVILGAIMFNVAVSGVLLPPLSRYRTKHHIPEKDKDVGKTIILVEEEKEINCKETTEKIFISDVNGECIPCKGESKEGENCDNEEQEKEMTKDRKDSEKADNKVLINITDPRMVSLSTGDISNMTRNHRDKEDNPDFIYKKTRKLSKSTHVLHPTGESDHLFIGNGLKHRKQPTTGHHESTASLFGNIKHKALLMVQNSNTQRLSTFAYASNCDIAMASQGALGEFLWNSVHSVSKNKNELIVTSVDSLGSGQGRGKTPCCHGNSALFEWSLLKKPMFLLHLFSVFLGYTCYINVLFMLPDFAFASGLSQDMSAMCLSVVGILELVGRITFPPLTDILCCQRRTAWVMSIAAMGLLNIIITQAVSLQSLMVYASLFGYACGCFTTLIPILVTEANGPEKLGSSLGLTTLIMSVSVMTGPPICGTIKDKTGHWDFAFITIGILALIGATSNFVVICVRKRMRSNI